MTLPRRKISFICILIGIILVIASCSSFKVKTCAKNIKWYGSGDVHRMRNSEYRIEFSNPGNVADKLLLYAALAHLSYYDLTSSCIDHGKDIKDKELYSDVKSYVQQNGWTQITENVSNCNDDIGLYFGAWIKESKSDASEHEVMLVYRGTENDNFNDWTYGNFRWFTRPFKIKNQFPRSREETGKLMTFIETKYGKNIRYTTVGHSLGGGLAQNILYAFPDKVAQAFTFDPSPVTMYTDQNKKNQMESCDCKKNELGGETRIYRIYESGEVLSHLRYPLKLAINLNRHVSEIRFAFKKGSTFGQHSMYSLYHELSKLAEERDDTVTPWFKGVDNEEGEDCTTLFQNSQSKLCDIPEDDKNICPSI